MSDDYDYLTVKEDTMHHKRKRTKNQRAGCYCGIKDSKHNGWARLVKVKGVKVARVITRDKDLADGF